MQTLQVTSSAFGNGHTIPHTYSHHGQDLSPPLHWSAPPTGTKSFSVVCEDPDAPRGPFVHWLAYNIPPDRLSLEEGFANLDSSSGFLQGLNDYGTRGYEGPNPPAGKPHRYYFKVFALDSNLDLPDCATKKELVESMTGHLLAMGQIMGKYPR